LKPLVMIVDDDRGMLNLLSIILTDNGYDVLAASNGIAALNLLSCNLSPDIIITDYCMPRLKGSKLIEAIYACDDLKYIPAVILSGSDLTSVNLPQTDNFRGVINKPFRVNTLLQTLNDLIKENGYGSSVHSA